jgi:hypothetical protein
MRKLALTTAATALVLALVGVVAADVWPRWALATL